jgi:ribose 5-phosphate isomerase A
MTNSEKALEFIKDGFVVGLGTGRAASAFIHCLGKLVHDGLRVVGVPTSQKSADLAKGLGIPLTTLDDVDARIEITVDGADEVDRNLNLIKGMGGALVREKIVAAASKHLIILIGPDNLREKDTGVLGTRGVLPVEVVPFALTFCRHRLEQLGLAPASRMTDGKLFLSDNGNYILDCKVRPISDPRSLEQDILMIPGVVGTGLFVGLAHTVLVQDGDRVEVRQKNET